MTRYTQLRTAIPSTPHTTRMLRLLLLPSWSFLVNYARLLNLYSALTLKHPPRVITNSFYSFFRMIHNCFASTVRLSLASFFLGRMAQSRIIMTWSHPLLRFRSCQNVTPYHRLYSPDWLPALHRL